MAGIGFELRKQLRRDTFSGLLRGYGYAGAISSGPWVFSILGVMLMGYFALQSGVPSGDVRQFYISITYLMAGSLVLTGTIQLQFTRYIADRLFERLDRLVVPNMFGAMTLTAALSGSLGSIALWTLFGPEVSLEYRILMVANFVTLCEIWLGVVLLSGLKAYRAVLVVISSGYVAAVLLTFLLRPWGREGLLLAFFFGNAGMLFAMITLVVRNYRPEGAVSFEFLAPKKAYYSLMLIGLFNNVGIWADKLLFWYNPLTSDPVVGPLRASLIYDLPIFLAYLSIVPGMGVFLVRVETDFAEHYEQFYDAVREGEALQQIVFLKSGMVFSVRQGIYEIFKVQGLTIMALLLIGPHVLSMFGISLLYLPLFYVDVVAVGVQVVLLAILNVLFYLDQRQIALGLNLLFAGSNIVLTMYTQMLGAAFYGYGFAAAVCLTAFAGITLLSRKLDRLEYETFMLQT